MYAKIKKIGIWAGAAVMIALLLILLTTTIFAAEPDDIIFSVQASEDSIYDGYIFKLKDEVQDVPDTSDAGIEILQADENLFTADSIEEIRESFTANEIEYIEPDYILTAADTVVDDPLYASQWGLTSTDAETVLQALQDGEITASNATVGVIDSGLRISHEDFNDAYIAGKNYGNPSTPDDLTDMGGHGTMVTSVIAATTNNGLGNASLGYGADVVVLKGTIHYQDEDGARKVGMMTSTMVSMVYSGVDDYGCDVINISYGGSWTQAMETACLYAYDKGVIICAAVGNDGDDTLNYPAALDSVIGVGAMDPSNDRAYYSNCNESVFVVAPGSDIAVAAYSANDSYAFASGTSLAAPFVSALAVLAKSYEPDMSVEDFKSLLKNTATDKGEYGYDTEYGYGLVNCAAFVDLLLIEYDVAIEEVLVSEYTHIAYVAGWGDGTFRPDLAMSRAEAVQMLYNMSKILDDVPVTTSACIFTDVPGDAWYYTAVVTMTDRNVISGYGDGTFRPEATISRAEFTAMVVKYAGLTVDERGGFPDVSSTYWAAGFIRAASEAGYVNGYSDGYFWPEESINRASTVALLNNMQGRVPDVEILETLVMPFSDVPRSHWAWAHIMDAAVGY